MRTIAILNLKGGVGKTTTALNMAYILNKGNKKVLIVDNDIQANITKHFNLHDYNKLSIEDIYAKDPVRSEEVIRHTKSGIDLIPSNMNLDVATTDLTASGDRLTKLINALDQIKTKYDYCIIDCPPSVGINVLNALFAANDVIIPIKIDAYALDGMQELAEIIEELKQYNKTPPKVKCLITMSTNDTYIQAAEKLLRGSKYSTFKTKIRFSKRVPAWTLVSSKSLQEYTPQSAAPRDYKEFVNEYINSVEGKKNAKERDYRPF